MKILKIGGAILFLFWALGAFIQKTMVEPREQKERTARQASPTRKWTLNRGRSSFDDSPRVELLLQAETPISGWPGKLEKPILVLRCQERKTEAYIQTGMAANPEYGRLHETTVRVRLDHDPAIKLIASESTDNQGLFFREPISLIRSLVRHEQLTFGFTPFNSSAVETVFDLRGLDAAIIPLRESCGWK